ncbi:MAG: hypothetical protein LBE59_02955 [Nevskiaceae bacterium]|jgi:hypothetical protein|nr:hypothetical protein [Nevskiaceae bacterium]
MLPLRSTFILPLLATLLLCPVVGVAAAAREAAPQWVSTPRATRLPISATNRPFLAANRAQSPVDLAAGGYVEEEALLSGRSNLYDWGPDARARAATQGPGESWTTRMLIRRPSDQRRFSGRVVLELLAAADQYDTAPVWGLSQPYFMRSGDVWVGLTIQPSALAALQRFDPVRYAKLSLPAPKSLECAVDATADAGLAWDLIAQAGAMVRSASKENPLAELHPRRVVLAGHGDAGGYVIAYANAMNQPWRLVGGSPVFNAYVSVSSARAQKLHPCAAALDEGDPRNGVMPRDVPFLAVMTQGDLTASTASTALPVRRASSDAPDDTFGYYELPAAAPRGLWPAGLPAQADLSIAAISAPEPVCRQAPSNYPAGLVLNALWRGLDSLLIDNQPMIQTPRIETDAAGQPLLDEQGNALGGWRLPMLDVPLAAYAGHGEPAADAPAVAGNLCARTATMRPLEPAQLKALHGDRAGYLKRFNEAIDGAVDGRRLLAEDAQALKNAATRAAPTF